jgi:pimeloyl-ACP methyl ester carboxylesterase
VRHLVYLTAFMPDEGGSVQSEAAQKPSTEMTQAVRVNAAGRMALAPESIGPVLYGDCDEETVAWASASVRSMQVNFADGVRAAAWRTTPSTYVVCGQDRVILPELQRRMAVRASRVVEWDTSHSPFASRPELVANLLIDLARAEPSQT